MVGVVACVQETRAIHGQASGIIVLCRGGGAIGKAGCTRARQGAHCAPQCYVANVVAYIAAHGQARGVEDQALVAFKARGSALAIGSARDANGAREKAGIPVARRLRAQPRNGASSGGVAGKNRRGCAARAEAANRARLRHCADRPCRASPPRRPAAIAAAGGRAALRLCQPEGARGAQPGLPATAVVPRRAHKGRGRGRERHCHTYASAGSALQGGRQRARGAARGG
jgi:hypothetical protein